MKITLCTVHAYRNGSPDWACITWGLMVEYCLRWGWECMRRSNLTYPNCHPVWEKMPLIRTALDEGADWVVWMDADAAPVNMDSDITSYLAYEEKKVIMLEDINGINAGVFAIPNTRECHDWLSFIESERELPQYRRGLKEQNAMRDSFMTPSYRHLHKTPPKELGWNSYLDIYPYVNKYNLYREGDWCLHVPGSNDETRNKIFKELEEKRKNEIAKDRA